MITVVSLNPCIDKTVYIENFGVNKLNRIVSSRIDPSGKGVNVALDIKALGGETVCIGFMRTSNGGIVENRLKQSGVAVDFIYLPGEVRVNIKVVDPISGTYTEINDGGDAVDADAIRRMEQKIEAYAAMSEIMVFTGSIPPGVPADIYGRWIKIAKIYGAKTILDADGEALRYGIESAPYMVKPNIYELERYLGRTIKGKSDVKDSVDELLSCGIVVVLISMGAEGAVIGYQEDGSRRFYSAPAVPVCVKSTTGAGDAMVSAMAIGMEQRQKPADMFRWAMAAAAAAVMTEGTQPITRENTIAVLDNVRIEEI